MFSNVCFSAETEPKATQPVLIKADSDNPGLSLWCKSPELPAHLQNSGSWELGQTEWFSRPGIQSLESTMEKNQPLKVFVWPLYDAWVDASEDSADFLIFISVKIVLSGAGDIAQWWMTLPALVEDQG